MSEDTEAPDPGQDEAARDEAGHGETPPTEPATWAPPGVAPTEGAPFASAAPDPVTLPGPPAGETGEPAGPGTAQSPVETSGGVQGATSGAGEKGSSRRWIPVVVVAALIGAAVGAGVTAIADHVDNGSNSGVTVNESNAAPGAAVLNGNVTIPELVDKVVPAVVSIDVKSNGQEDQGTGMIITADGEVITNNHVIELYTQGGNSGSITVTEYGQTKALPSTLVGYDQSKDVALLKIDSASGLPTVTFGNSAKAVVGDAVVAIGNALGLSAGTPTVTQGIISALGRSVTAGGTGTQTETLQNMIQTDAAINPGNSGGPLVDTSGQVIGMNTAVAGTSSDGTSSQNIGFAIPAATVESLIPALAKGGQTGNAGGYLGVEPTTLTPALRQQYGFTPTTGAVILSVVAGSPAAKAGLVQGDIIVAVDNTPITTADGLVKVIQGDKPGQTVTITYWVGDSKRTTNATLGSLAQAQQQQSTSSATPFGAGGFPGLGNSGNTP